MSADGFARFQRPDPWHSPATYWFWHHLPSDDTIRTQIRQMYDAGIRSFQVQARLSYPIDRYLDEDYLAACRVAVLSAAQLGMIVGVYDDYNWQSGHAAGLAVRGHDELRERHLFWVTLPAGQRDGEISGIRSATENLGAAAMAWHYDGSVVAWADWRIEHVLHDVNGAVSDRPDLAVLAAASADGCRVTRTDTGADDRLTVLVSARCATSRLINPLDPVAVDRFIEAGYEPFARAVGDYFGSTVAYMFFDQPHAVFYDWAGCAGNLRTAMPYHERLASSMRERWGSAVPQVWAAVFGGEDAQSLGLRAQFYDHFGQYARETFLGRVRDWSHAHGLKQSGHEVLGHVGGWSLDTSFADWDLRVNFGLDHFGVDAYRDLTAVDAQDAVMQLSPILGDSVARHHGRRGTLVEQYFLTPPAGGAPWSGHWGLSLQELRTTAISHHLHGMRQMIFHGFYQTHGHGADHESLRNPRFDFPPGINFEPWFADHHARFAIESARLSEFLDPVVPQCDVAMLYPLRTVWTAGQTGDQSKAVGDWARALTEAGVPFQFIDERDLESVVAADGVFQVGDRSYRSLVLPAVTTLRSAEVVRRLGGLTDNGVRIIATGRTPWVYQDGAQTASSDWVARGPTAETYADVPPRSVVASLNAHRRVDEPRLVAASEPPVRWRGGADDEGNYRFACFNDGEGESVCELCLPAGEWRVEEWLADDGSWRLLASADLGRLRVEPQQLRLLHVALAGSAGDGDSSAGAKGERDRWSSAEALASEWSLEIPPDAHEEAGTVRAISVTEGWEQQGLPTFAGVAAYMRTIDVGAVVPLELTLPKVSGGVLLSVNGIRVGARGWMPYRFEIPAAALVVGANELRIEVAPSAANRYYAGTGLRDRPEPCGLQAAPLLRYAVDSTGTPAAVRTDGGR